MFILNITDFCTLDTEQRPLWEAVQDQATESYAIREVFNMDSSVRVEAIENLGTGKVYLLSYLQ